MRKAILTKIEWRVDLGCLDGKQELDGVEHFAHRFHIRLARNHVSDHFR